MKQFFPSPDQLTTNSTHPARLTKRLFHLKRYEQLLDELNVSKQMALPAIDWQLSVHATAQTQIFQLSPNSFGQVVDYEEVPQLSCASTLAHELLAVLAAPVLVINCAPHDVLTISLEQIYTQCTLSAYNQIQITVGSYAQLTFIDDRTITTATHVNAIHVEIQPHAQVSWIDRSNQSSVNAALLAVSITLHEHAHIIYHTACRYAMNSLVDWHVTAKGAHATASALGLAALSAHQKLIMRTTQHHEAPTTTSSLLIKGLVTDNGFLDFAGLIHIAPDAAQSSAHQENKNMLFSDTAQARSIPSLEALNNDVQCSHASATGYFDNDQLTYMASRGLSIQQARQLLLKAFCADIIKDLDDELQQTIFTTVLTMMRASR